MTKRDRGTLILIVVVTACLLALIVLFESKANAQGPCCPPGETCGVPGYGGWAGAGIPGPYGGGIGVRAAPGRGIQAGVGGPYGGVIGAQVGPGLRVQAGVIPGNGGWQAPPTPAPNQSASAVQHCPAVVKIETTVGNTVRHGTGTLISLGGRWHILTAAHILAAGYPPEAIIDGQRIGLRIIAADALHDVALLGRVSGVVMTLPAMEVSGVAPASAAWQGFAGGGGIVGGSGRVQIDGELLTVPGKAPEGTSGGPIYCRAGLVSVITEANNGPGYWVSAGPRPEWLVQWVQAAYAADRGNGVSPGDLAGGQDPIFPPPVDTVCRDQFDAAIERLEARDQQLVDRLMVHSAAIAEIKLQIDNQIPSPGPPGPPGKDADPAAFTALEARVAALEQAEEGPLFTHESYINGELIDRGEVWRGQTLKYTAEFIDGAPTKSFNVEVDSPGGMK